MKHMRSRPERVPHPAPAVPMSEWGRDHWSTFAYLASLAADRMPPTKERMRCDRKRHPHLAHADGRYPTVLRGGIELADHDDWDCANDIQFAGLIKAIGTGLRPQWLLTDDGLALYARLIKYKQGGGSFPRASEELCPQVCAICKQPRGDKRWTLNGGAPAHVQCALAGSKDALIAAGLREKDCDDCGAPNGDLITKGDHHGGRKTVCRDRDACHRRSPG